MSITPEDYNRMEATGEFDVSNVRCAECKYWRSIRATRETADAGSCYRYPPVFDPSWLEENKDREEHESQTDSSYWVRPVTDKHSFCGEHMKREDL